MDENERTTIVANPPGEKHRQNPIWHHRKHVTIFPSRFCNEQAPATFLLRFRFLKESEIVNLNQTDLNPFSLE